MEPEGLLLLLKVPTICPYPEPDQPSACSPSHFLKIHLSSILTSMPGSFKWSHSLRFPHRNPVYTSPLPVSVTCPAKFIHYSGHTKRISPGPSRMHHFRNEERFYGEELLAPRPAPKLEDHSLSAVRDCSFSIFTATIHIGGRSSIRAMPRWQGPAHHMVPAHYVTCVNFVSKFWNWLSSVNISRFLVILYLKYLSPFSQVLL